MDCFASLAMTGKRANGQGSYGMLKNDSANLRSGGRILVDQLVRQGVEHVFCVPGESYLAALDALYDASINVTVCRQEAGATMMAAASAVLTGRPGICFVTRGPGATNAAHGLHIAEHDSRSEER